MECTIAVAVVVAILILAVFLGSMSRKRSSGDSSSERVGPSTISPSARTKQVLPTLSATELLSLVHRLRDQNAQWDVIWSALNPTNDAEVQRQLVEIRGPHMFAPHLGLSVIEDRCRRVLALSPNADALTALREAIRSQEPFVR